MMNDDKLITAVREPFTDVHMNTPVEQIVRRGRALRTRRRTSGIAGALALVAAAAVAVTVQLPASHHGSHRPTAQLAAWTVSKQPNGTIYVRIHELRNPAGLQSRLRAEGVPASVTFDTGQNPSCRNYSEASASLTKSAISSYYGDGRRYSVLVIHPSALPSDAGVLISVSHIQHPSAGGVAFGMLIGLVQASPQCTGS